jgi:hypothetical protein
VNARRDLRRTPRTRGHRCRHGRESAVAAGLNEWPEGAVESKGFLQRMGAQFMFRPMAVLVLAMVAAPGFAAMMGVPVSTAPYFPLVDGARYDYTYTGGPRAASTAVMHGGQNYMSNYQADALESVTATGTLDKYRGGQCASCTYRTFAEAGNDGAITVSFSSPTAATVQLPGGRVTRIQPEGW